MRRYIKISLQVEGIHCWNEADKTEHTKYLQYPHRHIFHITVEKEVSHNNREIEIISFKKYLLEYIQGSIFKDNRILGSSCEDIAEDILKRFNCSRVEVLEDNENGGIVTNGK